MSKTSNATNATASVPDDDPLAELARIVSAGSVFSSDDTTNDPEQGSSEVAPPVEPAPDRLTEPAAEAVSVSSASLSDLDAELGAQLEAELVSELYESEPINQPQVETPVVETPSAPRDEAFAVEASPIAQEAVDASLDADAPTDERITSALDEALNLENFLSEEPLAKDAPAAPPTVEPEIDFDSFEAEIAAAATSGFPPVDGTGIDTVSQPTTVDNASLDPLLATAARSVDDSGLPADFPSGDIDPLDTIDFDAPEDDFSAQPANDSESNGKSLLAIAAVLAVALLGGAGAYFIGAFDGNSNEPVVVAANDEPVRVKPDDPGGEQIPNQDRTVYNTLDSEEDDAKQESRLVVRSEEPEVDQQTRPRVILPSSSDNNSGVATVPPRGPRTVKTVIVRPDGTLVQPEDVPDPVQTASEEASIVADVRAGVEEAEQAVASAGEELTPRSVSTEALTLNGESDATNDQSTAGATAETESVQLASLPPIPRANNDRNRRVAAQPQAEPQQTAQPAATPAANTGNFMVQLSAQRSDEAARTNFRRLQQRYSVLANYAVNVQRADLGDRGVYHRVRVGPFARSEANTLCQRLKSQGGDCIVRRR